MTTCTRCAGFGLLMLQDGRGTVPCSCRPDAELYRAARIPKRYELTPPADDPDPMIGRLLFGPPGTGKTWRAVSLLKAAVRIRSGARFVDLPQLEQDRRAAVRFNPDERMPGEELFGAAFVVLDDLARQPRMTEFWEEFLAALIRHRYNADLPTVFTTNHGPEDLEARIGSHLTGRITEMSRAIEQLAGKDWRAA